MVRSAEEAAKNASTFRRMNETLEEKAAGLDVGDGRTPYLCECEDEDCTQIVELTREKYEAVRANPRRFVVLSGHQETDDRVVGEGVRYTVIEKSGRKGDLVAERDPRSRKA